jgi:uncharacterized protein (TIGR00725 family)
MIYVAVCGPGRASAEEESLAEEVGRLLAEAGAIMVCGGTTGVMDAAARGARAGGGTCIGILPGRDRSEASPHLTHSLPTGMGEGRNVLVARAADALIAISGEYGTLSEIAFARRIGVPVVGLRTWELHRRGERVEAYVPAATPQEAVEAALQLAAGSTPSGPTDIPRN